MPTAEQIQQALATVPRAKQKLSGSQMDLQTNTTGDPSVVAEYQADRPLGLRDGKPYEADIPAYESETSDGTADNSETITLGHDLVDAESVPNDVVVFVEGTGYVQPDAVRYDADEIDVTDPGTDNTIHIWYMAGDQARIVVRKTSPKGVPEDVDEDDMGLKNLRNQHKDPLRFDFERPYEGVIPTDWTIQLRIDAPYQVQWSAAGGDAEPTNARISLPIFRARDDIPGLGSFIGQIAGGR
jgi:hypothetical protein